MDPLLNCGMTRKTLTVSGMSCGGCEQNVEDALESLEGVSEVAADHDTESVEVEADESVPEEKIQGAIEDAGYDVVA